MSAAYGPEAATRADAARASIWTAAVNAGPPPRRPVRRPQRPRWPPMSRTGTRTAYPPTRRPAPARASFAASCRPSTGHPVGHRRRHRRPQHLAGPGQRNALPLIGEPHEGEPLTEWAGSISAEDGDVWPIVPLVADSKCERTVGYDISADRAAARCGRRKPGKADGANRGKRHSLCEHLQPPGLLAR
jgi:hypothetical protein